MRKRLRYVCDTCDAPFVTALGFHQHARRAHAGRDHADRAQATRREVIR